MATMNRIFSLYSAGLESALDKPYERGLLFMPSYKTKLLREIVALTEIHQE